MTLLVHSDNLKRRQITVSPQAERNYAAALENLSTHFYDGKAWVAHQNQGNDQNTLLVEFWEKQGQIEHHESRSPFIWVDKPKEQGKWHEKVTDSILWLNRGFKRGGQAGMDAQAARSAGSYDLNIPGSNKPTAASVIGYTSEEPATAATVNLSSSRVAKEQQGKKTYEASVYYREGHYTLDHKDQSNIGWKDKSGWTRLCFANVPVQYLNGNYVPGQPVLVNLGGLHQGQGTFMFGYVNAFVVSLFPPNSYIVDLARPTGKNYSITRVTVPDELYQEPGHQSRHHRIKAN